MAKSSTLIQQFARVGALARLNELEAEIAEIERAFPDLAAGRRSGRSRAAAIHDHAMAPVAKRRARKPMTAAQKKAVGERMRKYWAARRKTSPKSKNS